MIIYRTPVVDINEGKDEVTLAVELPGVELTAIDITYHHDVLTVRGEKKSAFGSFVRSFRMPKGMDETKIDARYENGVLTIRVPKAAVPQPRKIEIKTAA
jgi:HSP20 family protein